VILSYRYRIEPNRAQATALSEMLADFCHLYNAALEHRITAYRHGVSIRCNEPPFLAALLGKPEAFRLSVDSFQECCREV
jgi:hypothetical protein